MTFAPNYNPTVDFANEESLNVAGRSTVRTPAIDLEHANIASSINALNANIKLLQRDDGKLNDFLIEPYALSEQALALLSTNGAEPRGNWTASTVYAKKDIVNNLNITYMCHTAHTSTGSFDSTKWVAITGDGSAAISAVNAQNSASAAAASAALALTNQINAANSAGAAATSQTNAAASASAASVSAAAALTSQTVASSAAAVAASGIYSPWIVTALTPTFINTRTFSLVGNQTANYHVGRRVRATNTGGIRYATIIASVFSSVTTVTLGFQNTTDALDSGLSAVDISTETYLNPAIHQGVGSIIDLTGYTGADVVLGIGQLVTYSLSAVNSVLLRIATTNEQCYEIELQTNYVVGSIIANAATFQPNNTNSASANIKNHTIFSTGTATGTPQITLNNIFIVSASNSLMRLLIRVCTRTLSKRITSDFVNQDNTVWYQGRIESEWADTTTGWTSLGKLNFQNTLSARLTVKRLW